MKKLIFGDGTVPCLTCGVALCHSGSNYCPACGGPLRNGLVRRLSGVSAVLATFMAQQMAEDEGIEMQ